MITDSNEVSQRLTSYLQSLDDNLASNHPPEELITFPRLRPISIEQLACLVECSSQHKALAPFPFPDELLRHIHVQKSSHQLLKCWDPEFLINNPEIFECKLVSLNKAHPKVPLVSQMRPIVATNPIFKLIESRFITKLQKGFWNLPGFAKAQCGFLPSMSTQVLIWRLLEQITINWELIGNEYKKKNNQ